METIKVNLNAFYDYEHGCGSYGSNKTIEVEVNEQELEALHKLGIEAISCKDVIYAIEKGEIALKALHEKLKEKFYYMVEEYWLYDADNECIDESLQESYDADTMNGVYPPVSYEECIQWFKTKNIDSNKRGFLYDFEEIYYDCGEENLREQYDKYCIGKYYEWVCEHDHAFIAERVGLAIESCRDYEVDYTISLMSLHLADYRVGDSVKFELCGPDYTSYMDGKVVFANKEHILVQIPCYTLQYAIGLNRNGISYEEVERILGCSVESIKIYEYDIFVDLMDPHGCRVVLP